MSNPAAIPTAVEDVLGDGRWMSMVLFFAALKDTFFDDFH